jgi:probable HAF family extracellular repeat protein
MIDLGTLPGGFFSEASGINNKGQAVGISCDETSSNCSAFIWQKGVMTNLNDVIPADSPLFLIKATAINERGQIAGFGLQTSTGELHAYLATPRRPDVIDENATNAPRGRPLNVVLPTNVRNMLRESLLKPYVRGGFGGWNLMR